jgi:hypothetical protein
MLHNGGLKETIGADGSITVEDGGVAVRFALPLAIGLVVPQGSKKSKKGG